METVKFHFDPRCPWCFQTSRWIRRLAALGEIEADWGVFSLEVVNLREGQEISGIDYEAGSWPALRSAIVIRDKFGSKEIGRFYAALGKRLYEQSPPRLDVIPTVRESLEEAGFDPGILDQALADRSTIDAVLKEHSDLIEVNKSFGVPTIVLDGGEGPAIFGPVICELPDDETCAEMWKHVSWLTRYRNFAELKRDRISDPVLPGWAWRVEERRRQMAEQGRQQ